MITATKLLRPTFATSLLASLLTLAACTDEGGDADTSDDALELVGTWTDEFGDTHTIDEMQWQNAAGSFEISEWDNTAAWLVAQNAASNEYFPMLWSRFEWTWADEGLHYCQSVFDAASGEDAIAAERADPGDLTTGCGGFAWTRMD